MKNLLILLTILLFASCVKENVSLNKTDEIKVESNNDFNGTAITRTGENCNCRVRVDCIEFETDETWMIWELRLDFQTVLPTGAIVDNTFFMGEFDTPLNTWRNIPTPMCQNGLAVEPYLAWSRVLVTPPGAANCGQGLASVPYTLHFQLDCQQTDNKVESHKIVNLLGVGCDPTATKNYRVRNDCITSSKGYQPILEGQPSCSPVGTGDLPFDEGGN